MNIVQDIRSRTAFLKGLNCLELRFGTRFGEGPAVLASLFDKHI
jgi:hypothetical protein